MSIPEEDDINETPTLSARGTPSTSTGAVFRGFPVSNWDKYEFVSYIGAGGMGEVHKALDPRLKRYTALKFIRGDDPTLIQRFLREAQAQAQVEHENVCRVYETGEVEGKLYISMQFIDGVTLRKAQEQMSLEQKVHVMKKVAEGAHAAHRLGLIHRDIKPANIMVERTEEGDWKPYVMDFGLVREIHAEGVTMTGSMLGTPGYMSPEQAWGEGPLDRRADVYSLGATLYQILSGHLPLEGNSSIEILKKLLREDAAPLHTRLPSIPRDLEIITMKCLEREPQQRYDSARAMAEDLQRFLDGDPIQARPPSLSYRLRKKVRKNKALVVVSAVALFAVLLLGSMAIISSVQAGRRAAAAQRFGQQVEKMESVMRIGHGIPVHDIRQEKKLIRDQMKSIETQMRELGALGLGPGEYALGRGYLSLDEYENALKHLQKAWDAGYREAEESYALGLTLGQLFQKELEAIELIQNQEERQRRRVEAEKKYRDPAVKSLQSVRGLDVASQEYLEGLIDYYEKHYEQALQKAQATFQKLPWFYEALLLMGDVHLAIAGEKRSSGDYDTATAAFGKAEQAYEAAIRIGESDIHGYNGLAEVYMGLMNLQLYEKGGDLKPYLEKVLGACQTALKLDPEVTDFYNKRSVAYRFVGENQINHGEDPTQALKSAVQEVEQAIKVSPTDGFAYANLGTAQQLLAENDLYSGRDPGDQFNVANQNLQKSLELDPSNTYTYNILCIGYQDQGIYESMHGKDPTASLQKAIEYGKKGLAINPKNLNARINLGSAQSFIGVYWQDHGQDPRSQYQEAIATFEHAMQINPNSAYLNNNLGSMYVRLGEYELLHGSEPSSCPKAIPYLEKALKINPQDAFPYFNLRDLYRGLTVYDYETGRDPGENAAKAYEAFRKGVALNPGLAGVFSDQSPVPLTMARYALERKKDPTKDLQQARELTQKALSIDPGKETAFLHIGEIEILEGWWLKGRGGSPAAHYTQSEAALRKAIGINAQDALPHLRLAELRSLQAAESKNSTVLVNEGLEQAETAIRLNPSLGEAYALKGVLLKQSGAGAESSIAIAEALKINANLKRRYGQ